jgi:serine/threonine protein phosphatase 1
LKVPQLRISEFMTSVRRHADDAQAKLAPHLAKLGQQMSRVRDGVDNLLNRYMPTSGGPKAPPAVPLALTPAAIPDGQRVYAIGDVHGRADLLKVLLAKLQKDALGGDYKGRPKLVFLGDYIDRGFQSREVIDILLGDLVSPFDTFFLKGNHEAAMLQFLSEPGMGPRWVEHGGAETLVSYGVRPPRSRTAIDEWALASQELKRQLPREHLQFLMSLQVTLRIGDYMFVHAGVRPGVELDQQSEYDMLWIREEFLNDTRPLGVVVVHGHTPASKPHRDSRRVGLDTGAYISGQLTAARFEHAAVEFLSTGVAAAKAATVTR